MIQIFRKPRARQMYPGQWVVIGHDGSATFHATLDAALKLHFECLLIRQTRARA